MVVIIIMVTSEVAVTMAEMSNCPDAGLGDKVCIG